MQYVCLAQIFSMAQIFLRRPFCAFFFGAQNLSPVKKTPSSFRLTGFRLVVARLENRESAVGDEDLSVDIRRVVRREEEEIRRNLVRGRDHLVELGPAHDDLHAFFVDVVHVR